MFKQFVVLFFMSQMASGLFRAIASLGRNMIVANTFGSFAVLTLFALGGFILSRSKLNCLTHLILTRKDKKMLLSLIFCKEIKPWLINVSYILLLM